MPCPPGAYADRRAWPTFRRQTRKEAFVMDGGAVRLWQMGAPAEVVICAAKGTVAEHMAGARSGT